MSRRAVSWEQLHIFAHLEEVSLPSNPSHNLLIILRWRSLTVISLCLSQYAAFCSVVCMAEVALVMAFFAADRKIVCGLAKIRENNLDN